jgi:hypothetical protein
MLRWRDLGAIPSNNSPPRAPTQVRGPRRRPSTQHCAQNP